MMQTSEGFVDVLAGGGLSSWTVARALQEAGRRPRVLFARVGQVDEPLVELFLADMRARDIPVVNRDLRNALGALGLEMTRFGLVYERTYWNTTGALRLALMRSFAPTASSDGASGLAHGAVGGGNDERRFARYGARLAPGLPILSPWSTAEMRERFPDRAAMAAYLGRDGDSVELDGRIGESSDGSVLGVSYEGCAIEPLEADWFNAPFAMTRAPAEAPMEPAVTTLSFGGGELVAVDAKPLARIEALSRLNALAGSTGVGRAMTIETRTTGAKGRGVYDAPGLVTLGHAYAEMARLSLDGDAWRLYEMLSATLSRALYEGAYEEDAALAARDALTRLTSRIEGEIRLCLWRGTLRTERFAGAALHGGARRQTRFGAGGHVWA